MEKDKIRSFKDLGAWKQGHALVVSIYKLSQRFPKEEQFGITNQMRRAAVSVTSNLAEGFSRRSFKEKSQFYAISQGSLTELQNQMLISRDVGYLSDGVYAQFEAMSVSVHKLINGLIKYAKSVSIFLLFPLILSTFYFLLPAPSAHAWFNANWSYRVKLEINPNHVDATLTNFPVYVDLDDMPSTFFDNVISGCGDLRVVEADDTTETAREIVFCDTATDNGELYFLADSISATATTTFYIYYSNPGASDYADNATYGAENVWINSFQAVYHLQGTPGTVEDSTANGYDATASNMDAGNVTTGALSGSGYSFNGTDEQIQDTDQVWSNSSNAVSISLWALSAAVPSITRTPVAMNNGGERMFMHVPSASDFVWDFGTCCGADARLTGDYSAYDTVYTHILTISNGTNLQTAYLNGVNTYTKASADNPNVDMTGLTIGSEGGTVWYEGNIDEVRLATAARDDAWADSEYTNQATPTTFYYVASQESASFGDWYNSNYQYCRELTMTAGGNSGGVATTTTGGFALVATSTISSFATVLSGGRIQNTQLNAHGTTTPKDVIITNGTDCADDGGTQVLDFYFEKYASTTGEFVLWVEPVDISSTTQKSVLMYYGYNSAADQSDEAGVFGALGEVGVWNLSEDPTSAGANGILDSTSNNNDATDYDDMSTSDQVAGIAGSAFFFDGANDYVGAPASASLGVGDTFTVSVWIKLTSNGTFFSTFWNFDDQRAVSGIDANEVPNLQKFNGGTVMTASTNISDTNWHHVVMNKRGSSGASIYIDGVNRSGTFTDDTMNSGNAPFSFGGGDANDLEGTYDDVRVYSRAIHAMDQLTIYNNMRSSTIFWGFGAEQTYAGGDNTPARKLRLMGNVRLRGVRLIGL